MNILTILLALLIFGFLIFIHELGHYLAARSFGVKILEFSIGMGPKLLRRVSEKTGIAYSLRAFPIGGFVSMEGEDDESADENSFRRKPVWQRIIVTAAGAAMNLLVGVLVMGILMASEPILPSTVIGAFVPDENGVCYAESAGLQIGDEIVAVNGTRTHIANEVVYEIMRKGVDPLRITVIRDGQKLTVDNVIFPTFTEMGTRFGTVDFKVMPAEKNAGTVLKEAFFRSVSTVKMIWESLFDLISGRYGMEAVSGPVGVTKALGEAAEQGTFDLVYLAVVISMNLGVMNLLPLPALDGGRLVFQFAELIRRKPVRAEIEGYVHFAGLVVLMILMVVIAVKDVIGLF
ncbi:MAG: site-2 protease family protein [Clostridia bacterium]|nr:site-2 protease family protein [Clostridia bacterium]